MRKFMNSLLAGAIALTMVAGASAQADPNAEVEVVENTSGVLSVVIADADFGQRPYSLANQAADNDDIVLTVTDSRGSNEGWNVTIAGTDFTAAGVVTTIPIENVVLPATGTVTGNPGLITGITTTGSALSDTPAKIISAAIGSGTGLYTVTFPASSLTIPGGTLVGTYQSTLTVTIATAP